MKLGENIKTYRKQRGLTQEQLAELMNVSVAAVSKWEAGTNHPELPTLLSLALLFKTSADALIGFEPANRSRNDRLDEIRGLIRKKDYQAGQEKIEDILCTYPNDFEILYACAHFFRLKGVERAHRPSLERALQLYEKAFVFLEQNRDPKINRTVLENETAGILIEMGKYDAALDILKKNNIYDINTLRIAQTLVNHLAQYEASLPLLSQEFFSNLSAMFNTAITFAIAYRGLGRSREAVDILQRIWPLIGSFVLEERVSIFDKVDVIYRSTLAVVQADTGDQEAALKTLRLAKRAALRFDSNPSFDLAGFPHFYVNQEYYVFDDFGVNSLEAVDSWLATLKADRVREMWNSVKEEKNEY